MSKPIVHARSSAKKWGGVPEDYMIVHELMDSSKAAHASVAHRSVFHTAFGCYIVEKIVGTMLTNSDGREICVRDIAEQHCIEDMGFIPSLSHFLDHVELQPWMAGTAKAVFARARASGKDKELVETMKLRKPEMRIVFVREGKDYPIGPFKAVSQDGESLRADGVVVAFLVHRAIDNVWRIADYARSFLPVPDQGTWITEAEGFRVEPV